MNLREINEQIKRVIDSPELVDLYNKLEEVKSNLSEIADGDLLWDPSKYGNNAFIVNRLEELIYQLMQKIENAPKELKEIDFSIIHFKEGIFKNGGYCDLYYRVYLNGHSIFDCKFLKEAEKFIKDNGYNKYSYEILSDYEDEKDKGIKTIKE